MFRLASHLEALEGVLQISDFRLQKIENVLVKDFSSLYQWFIDNKLSFHFGEVKLAPFSFQKQKVFIYPYIKK